MAAVTYLMGLPWSYLVANPLKRPGDDIIAYKIKNVMDRRGDRKAEKREVREKRLEEKRRKELAAMPPSTFSSEELEKSWDELTSGKLWSYHIYYKNESLRNVDKLDKLRSDLARGLIRASIKCDVCHHTSVIPVTGSRVMYIGNSVDMEDDINTLCLYCGHCI